MADNYLERKMEELRSGKTGMSSAGRYSVKRNMLYFPYKTLRVLIVADGRKYLSQYVNEFRNHEGRVAVFNTLTEKETDLPEGNGCRYYTISCETAMNCFNDLIKAWRDIDVVIMLDYINEVKDCLLHHVENIPYPNDWGMPVLEIGEGQILRHDSLDFIPLERHSIDAPGRNEPKILPYYSLPQNKCISRMILQQ